MERFIALVITWIALWGEINGANIITGLIVAAVITSVFPSQNPVIHHLRFVGACKFLGKFVVDLVVSSLDVARTVLFPTPERLEVKVVSVQLHTNDPLITTIVCNAMTLTPGTMTVAIHEPSRTMKLHVLGHADADTVQRHVYELEQRVMNALSCEPRDRKSS